MHIQKFFYLQYTPAGTLDITDLYLVNTLLVSAVHLWREFGLAVGLKSLRLEVIRSNNLRDAELCFTEMLAAWLNGEDRLCNSSGPNWEEVIAALKSPSVNMGDHMHQILQKLTG
jgi:hypothetical protein